MPGSRTVNDVSGAHMRSGLLNLARFKTGWDTRLREECEDDSFSRSEPKWGKVNEDIVRK
jgi:hypothetical protein